MALLTASGYLRTSTSLLLVVACAALTHAAEPAIEFSRLSDRLVITANEKPLVTYVYRDRDIVRPYFAHLHAPNGVQLSRNHPPVEGRDATDHATMHPGLWLGFGDLSGADFWRNKATVEHVRFLVEPKCNAIGGQFAVLNHYRDGERTICEERCAITIRPQPAGYLLLWDSQFSGPSAFYFGDQEEMGLGVRVATPLAVKNGGRMTNSDGLVNEKQVWGKQADWCDYSGTIEGQPLGVLIVADQKNFRRPWFHARDYGFMAANPFGQNAFTKGPSSRIEVAPGESLRLRFAVLLHSGSIDLSAAASDAQKLLDESRDTSVK